MTAGEGMRVAALVLGMAVAPFAVAADQPGSGATVFLAACAGCHGEGGDGAGPMSEILTVAVPDLTALAAGNGGVFPWLRVLHTVDGRTGIRAHGGPMPIFGLMFEGDAVEARAPDGTTVATGARVLAVVEYLETLQRGERE